jgi:predicted metal-dependent hydrolase
VSDLSHSDPFRRGVEQFNAGHFFEAHETWEEVWLHSPEPEKTFLQGIIQIAAAFHHRSRGNDRGTLLLLQAGLKRLARFPAVHRGIKLGALRAEAEHWVAALCSAPGQGPAVPKIHYSDND